MGLIKDAKDLTLKQSMAVMIYGTPGIGKTTLALSAPRPVLFDFDGGVNRVNPAHQTATLQVTRWEEVPQALEEVKTAGRYSTIVIDTVGKMLAYIEDYIARTMPRYTKADGSLSLQGYGQRKTIFADFNKRVLALGLNVIYVAHSVEDKQGDDTRVRPDLNGKFTAEILKDLDLLGFMESVGNRRTICFDPNDRYYSKNTCDIHGVIQVPEVVNLNGEVNALNNFLCGIWERYMLRQMEGKKRNEAYDRLINEARAKLAEIQPDDEDAKQAFAEWMRATEQVYNSRAVIGEMYKQQFNAPTK